MARTPWVISDWSTGLEAPYELPINPKEFNPPGKTANASWQRTTAPNGQIIMFQGLNEPAEGSFTGVVLTAAERIALEQQVTKWYPLQLTDDRNQTWWVLFTSVQWTRRHRYINPDSREYTVKFIEMP